MNPKNIILYVLLVVMSAPLYGENISKDNAKEDLNGYVTKQEQTGMETARLQWRVGISAFNKTVNNKDTGRKDKITVHKAPVFLELQVPFGVKMKGLVQAGLGWIRTSYDKCEDEGTGLRISSENRETEITTFKKCTKWKTEDPVSTGYLMIQPGLQYKFGSFTGMLTGGGFLNLEKEIGFMAGVYVRSTMLKGLDFGAEMLSYKDQTYAGISIKWGTILKTWTRME